MSETVIKVEGVSKQYRLGVRSTGTISHDLNRWWAKTRGREDPFAKIGEENDRTIKAVSEYVWALKDINFEAKKGEVLGIIGRNGAGKSTLLKLLSKVTRPTTGSIMMKGRVASLLEVGTGFHPELTGRENVFLNGAILGMTKSEIKRKFDEIVDFAGVERYIDTPVKRYSSGMYVRLAFAVAAHLEPEILIVDEVLAVGDAEFQKKCLGKMGEVSREDGRTILFVSHNMQSISALTEKSILLRNGLIETYDDTNKVIHLYFKSNSKDAKEYINKAVPRDSPYIESVSIHTSHPNNVQGFNGKLSVKFTVFTPIALGSAAISYQIFNSNNEPVLHVLNLSSENSFCKERGHYVLESIIPVLRLYPDDYYLVVHFADNFLKKKFQTIEYVCPFAVKVFGELRDYYWSKKQAVYVEDNYWKVQQIKR